MNNAIRCFIAVELDSSIHNLIKNIQAKLAKTHPDVKWVKPQNAHLTLKFLGNVEENNINQISNQLEKVLEEEQCFTTNITELGVFPTNRPARVIWIGLNDEKNQIHNWAKKIEITMKPFGFPKEGRSFKTHITIGRVRSNKNISQLTKAIHSYFFPPNLSQTFEYITLFKSTLTPEGPIYETLKQIRLKKSPR